jgi:RNA polymerase sigma-B factor
VLFARYARGDTRARDELVTRFLPLARRLARRYGRSSIPFDDLQQVASVGLLKAIDRFNPDRETAFASFAIPTILGEIRRYFRDCGWSVHVPRGAQERALTVQQAQQELTSSQRAPTVGQLAEYCELDREQVLDALQAVEAYEALSLDAPCQGDDGHDVVPYVDTMGAEDDSYRVAELRATIDAALEDVPEQQRTVLRLRFAEDLSQTEIAARIGVSQMQVSRLLRRALDGLRADPRLRTARSGGDDEPTLGVSS